MAFPLVLRSGQGLGAVLRKRRSAGSLPSLAAQSVVYFDRTDAPLGAVSALSTRGSWAQSFSNIAFSGGAQNVMEADGLKLNGNILRADMTRGPFSKISVFIDFTPSAAPLATVGDLIAINPAGATSTRVRLTYNSSFFTGIVPDNVSNQFWVAALGVRTVLGLEVDFQNGVSRLIGGDGEVLEVASLGNSPTSITRIELFKACLGKAHAVAVVAEEAQVAAPLPTITVTDGTITPFSRSGVNYVEILFQQSGSFTVSGDAPWHNRALAGGGANGGRATNTTYIPGGGGAGGLLRTLGVALAAGSYTVTIGAGAPANSTTGGGLNGSSSSLVTPSGTETAVGGGKGAMSGTGNTIGADGGSGGGGRGGSASQTSLSGGSGTSGQGYAGGSGLATDTEAQRGSGGGGGAGGAGGTAIAGTPGAAGPGLALDWIATPRTVCRGGPGLLATVTGSSADETWGNGSQGSIAGTAGKGGDGFLFLVVRADQVQVVQA